MNDSAIAAATGSILVSLLLTVGLYVWVALALQAVFRKTGEEGWKAWVPILNGITLLRLGGLSGWWMLLLLVPPAAVVVYVLTIVACHRLNAGFGYGPGMTVLAALLFPVWASVVGWSSNRWVGASPVAAHRAGPVRTGAPAASHAASPAAPAAAARPQALAWHTGAPPTASGFAPAAAAPAQPSASPAAPAGPVMSVPGREPLLISPELEQSAPIETDGFGDLRARHHAPFTGTTPVVGATASDQAPSAPRRAVAEDEPGPVAEPAPAPASSAPSPAPVERPAPTPAPEAETPPADPWAPPPAATRAALRSPEPYGFSDTSGEVSAVAGAPAIGSPMAARSSVSALRGEPEIPDAESAFDETILAARKRTAWVLVPPLGARIAVTQDVLVIGRRPSFDPAFPAAQLVSIADETRTMSKTHARLELRDGTWVITDLDSTNGVVLIDLDGSEIEVAPGRPMPIVERFLLGDAELALARDSA